MAPAIRTAEAGHVGVVSSRSGWLYDEAEETAAWQWPESVRTVARMRTNSTVAAVVRALIAPLLRERLWALDPRDARPEVVAAIAEDLDLPVLGAERAHPLRTRGRFSWLEHVRRALLSVEYGHMFFELVWDPDILKATGQARLRKLAPRYPASISAIDTAPDGGLVAIRQWAPTVERRYSAQEIIIPVDDLVAYAPAREASWAGSSILRPAYGDWFLLDRFLRVRAMLMERQGMGVPVGIASEGASDAEVQRMRDIASAARSGDYAGVGLPHGANLRFAGVEGSLPDVGAAVADHRAAIADAIGAHWMRLGTSEASGNRALGQTFMEAFLRAQDATAAHIAAVTTAHVVEDWVDLNYGPTEPAPAVVARPTDAEVDINPDDLVRLIGAGAITPDASVEEFLRDRYRLPSPSAPLPAATVGPSPMAAARRPGAGPHAARQPTWAERVAATLDGLVDAEAIAEAIAEGTDPADAVAAAINPDDSGPLAALLVEMWSASYAAGVGRAASTTTAAGRGRRAPVRASLADILARAGDAAHDMLTSLLDRLVAAVTGVDLAVLDRPALAGLLSGAAGDPAAAERIASTETHRAEVAGSVDTWAAAGVERLRWVQTTDEADECSILDGSDFDPTSPDFDAPPLHPGCLCLLEPA